MMAAAASGRRLYLITPDGFDPARLARSLEDVLSTEAVACVQLRWKGPDSADESILAAARALAPVCRGREVPLIINDRPDLVEACGAQGAHVGAEDMSCADARDLLGSAALLGVSCGDSRHRAYEAGEAGADYIAFGPCFPSRSKPSGRDCIDPRLFTLWSETTSLPSVAIGGITVERAAGLLRSGADYLAVIAAIWDHPRGPGFAAEQFRKVFEDPSIPRS